MTEEIDPADKAATDAARIGAEIARAGPGTDPFAAAVRATRMPMIVTDPRQADNPVVFANDSFCRLTGYARHEILGRNCRFLQGPETDPGVVARIHAAVAEGRGIEIDIRNYRKDGVPFWNRLLLAPVRDAAGQIAYFFASQVDVTLERERLEGLETHNAALLDQLQDRLRTQQDSEDRLLFAAQAGRLGIWELDLATSALKASTMCRINFGRDPAAPFTYKDLEAAVHPDDRARMEAAIARSIATGDDYDIEYRVIRPDGSEGWVQVRAQVVGASGQPQRMAGISLDITDARTASVRLQLSEEALRLATEAAEVGTWDLDLTTGVLTWTDRTRAMFGISPGLPCDMSDFYSGLHPDDLAATSRAFASALDPALRATYDVSYRTIGKEDGIIRWVAAKGRGLFEGDRCVRAIGTAIDITAQKAAETRQMVLVQLWDELRLLNDPTAIMHAAAVALGRHLQASRVGYGLVQDDDATVMLENSYAVGVERLGGRHRLDSFGTASIDRQRRGETVVQDDVHADPTPLRETWDAIGTRAVVSVPLVRDGALRAILFVNHQEPHAWTQDEISLIQDVAARTWDAVERARAEETLLQLNQGLEHQVAARTAELQASEARLRAVFETSYQYQFVLSPDGILLDANAASLNDIGVRREDVVGLRLWEAPWFAATEGIPDLVRHAVETAAAGQTFREEIAVVFPDGPRSFEMSLRPVRDEKGAVVAIVPEASDTTGRRQAEEALRQAQKMEAVGQLTGGLAHDFNNLLTGITGSLELLQARVAQGRVAEADRLVTAAQGAARRAASLTHRLLAFSRRQTLDPRPTDVNRLVAGMEELIRRSIGPQVHMEFVAGGGLWTTLVDPSQLESALLNLCINARDAMPDGGRLTVETGNRWLDERAAHERELPPGQYVSLCVSDTGTGMTPEVIARAFDPFFTTKPIGQGTGLGLSMIYGFARQSGGQVRIYSEPGHGTMVCIYLPRRGGPPEAAAPDPAREPAHSSGAGETVLVVDDEPTVRMLVTEILGDLGYRALEAADGPAGLRLLQSDQRIDLLVTDVGLPGGMNGRQLADAARIARPSLKILFITGYSENAVLGHGHLEPGMHVVTKPFAMEALAARIRLLLADAS